MSRHVGADDLASFAAADLRPRRAARVASHLRGCNECREQLRALQQVPELLASVQYPAIPDHLSARIEMAIASESATRVASEPGTEAGRRDLPAHAKATRRGLRMPRLSSPLALRLAASAAAVVLLGGGGYAMVSMLGSSSNAPSSASAPSVGGGALPGNMSTSRTELGPTMRLEHAGHGESVQTVQASTNFEPGTFKTQTLAAVKDERVAEGSALVHGQASGASPNASDKSAFTPAPLATNGPATFRISNLDRLRGCVSLIAAGRMVLLVELAKFEGAKATIIVLGRTSSSPAEAYAVGSGCSASNRAILFSLALPGL